MAESELALLAAEWEYHLRAKNLSPATIRSYREATRLLDEHLVAEGVTELADITRRHIEKFLIDQQGRVSSGSVLTRFRSLPVFFNWCVDEGELDRSPMARMKEPKGEQRHPDVPDDEDVSAMLKAISGATEPDVFVLFGGTDDSFCRGASSWRGVVLCA